ncbi:MAG: serine protease [Acidimicrobiales bacterium]|nr:serine protease [Acidimicrobiales bacterium]
MELEPGAEDEGPFFAWIPPEDRLWRHPSESAEARFERAEIHALTRAGFTGPSGGGARLVRAMAGSHGGRTWTVAVIAGLVGALTASGLGMATGWWNHQTTVVRAQLPATSAVSLAEAGPSGVNWTAIEESVAPMVVSLTIQAPTGPQKGSGLLVSAPGNGKAFVVTDRALFQPAQSVAYIGAIQVSFLAGTVAKARLVGQDSLSGLAVIEVADAVKAVPLFGTVANLRDADAVLAVGARDLLSGYVFTGSVSGQDREANLADGTEVDDLIALNVPSLSQSATGGPVLNRLGQVVGITVDPQTTDSSNQSLAFAVPIDEVSRVAAQLINGQAPTHAWLGVTDADDLPSMIAHQYSLTGGVQAGVVEKGSPAARIGMAPNDIITSIDSKPVTSTGALISILAGSDPGHVAQITYIHAGKTVNTTVVLGNEPAA